MMKRSTPIKLIEDKEKIWNRLMIQKKVLQKMESEYKKLNINIQQYETLAEIR